MREEKCFKLQYSTYRPNPCSRVDFIIDYNTRCCTLKEWKLLIKEFFKIFSFGLFFTLWILFTILLSFIYRANNLNT